MFHTTAEVNGLFSEIYRNTIIITFRTKDIKQNITRCNLHSYGQFL